MTEKEMKKFVNQIDKFELSTLDKGKIGGDFVSLKCGTTHYEIKGNGETVVLVHGYATPYYIYDKLFDEFVKRGYKTLRYELFGRGFSERPKRDYTPELFAEQLEELTNAVIPNEKIILVGTSMGGSICATFTAEHPEKVKKLALLAPAGMDTFKPPFYMKLCKVKGLGELVFYSVAGKLLLKKCASEMYYSTEKEKDYYVRKFAEAAKFKGFLRSTLSSLRNTILQTKKVTENYKTIGKTDIPILCIWGTIDKTMPYYQSARLTEVCKNAKLITYENSGHIFLFDEGERCAKDLLDFFAE